MTFTTKSANEPHVSIARRVKTAVAPDRRRCDRADAEVLTRSRRRSASRLRIPDAKS